jgi:RNA-directed DNA polymerase
MSLLSVSPTTSSSGFNTNRMRGDSSSWLGERLAQFGLELHPDKTRLIEFGRRAAADRRRRGLGKPETFGFLGFTHICARSRTGRFWVRRITIAKRMRAKPAEVKTELRQRRHDPIPAQGRWLAQVVGGHMAYYAVPGNSKAISGFRYQATLHWPRALRRRSQRGRITWDRMGRYANRWLPQARVMHPYPNVRFTARTQGRSPMR